MQTLSTIIIFIFVSFYKRIPLKLVFDEQTKCMEVTFIDRFKNEPKHLIVSLRELTYYLDEWAGKNSKKHKTIQLFHPIFGKINISEDDIEAFKFNELELQLKSLKK